MGKISDTGGFYMTMITSDLIISKETGQQLYTIPILNFKSLSARIRSDQILPGDIQVDVK